MKNNIDQIEAIKQPWEPEFTLHFSILKLGVIYKYSKIIPSSWLIKSQTHHNGDTVELTLLLGKATLYIDLGFYVKLFRMGNRKSKANPAAKKNKKQK